MILDHLQNAARYGQTHSRFQAAFEFLKSPKLATLEPGRHEINGDRLFVAIATDPGRGRSGAKLEVHRKYIDIQLVLSGNEEIGWKPAMACSQPEAEFDASRDIGFFRDAPALWLPMTAGTFAIFFPEDAHAPLGGEGPLRKAIAKVLIE